MNESTLSVRPDRSGAGPQTGGTGDDVVPARAFAGFETQPLKRAFAHPSGLLGRLAGWIMSATNTPLTEFAVRMLEPRPGDKALEIGFGTGIGLGSLIDRVGSGGFVAGLDPSAQMMNIAARRFRRHLSSGRLRLVEGSADRIRWPDETFDRVLSVSAVQFWKPASRSFSEVFRVLKGGGMLALGIHTQEEGRPARIPGFVPGEVKQLVGLLETAGFADITEHPMETGKPALCILARRPDRNA